MFFYWINHISTASILIPCIIGAVRYTKIPDLYQPFLYFIWLGSLNELISMILVNTQHPNLVNSNMYVLLEYALILFIFFRWNDAKNRNRYYLLLLTGLVIWILENIVINSLQTINAVFRVFYAFIVLYLSINQVNMLIVSEKKRLISNTIFLCCLSFIFYFSYKAFIETFYILHPPFSKPFYIHLFMILLSINFFTNLVYAIAILCIPTRREFIIPC